MDKKSQEVLLSFHELFKPTTNDPKKYVDVREREIVMRLNQVNTFNYDDLLEEHDQFYRDHKLLLFLFIFLGIYPIQRTRPGTMTHNWTSFASIYAYCLFVVLSIPACIIANEKITELVSNITNQQNDEVKFDEIIYLVIFVILFMPHFQIPFMGWMVATDVAIYKNSWATYQFQYYCVTGKHINFPLLKKLIVIISVGCLLIAIGTIQVMVHLLDGFLWHQTWIYYHIFTIINMNICLWYINCRAIGNAGDEFAADFKKEVEKGCSPVILKYYRCLWLDLYKIIENLGRAYTRTYTNYVLFLTVNIILAIYGFVSPAINFGDNGVVIDSTEFGLLGYFCYCFMLIFIFCNCADNVSHKISSGVQATLFTINLKSLSQDTVKEIQMFLRAIEMNSPVISLKGYALVDRSLITSCISQISGYLVVLIQFKVGLLSRRDTKMAET